jgi:hypothetical protein
MGGGKGKRFFSGTKGSNEVPWPDVKYPGDDPTVPPGPGFQWTGRGELGSSKGAWFNLFTEESWHPDLQHKSPIKPHWDHIDNENNVFRVYKDGSIELVVFRGKKFKGVLKW